MADPVTDPKPGRRVTAPAGVTVTSADPPARAGEAEPRIVRVSAHDAATGAEFAAVSGPTAAFAPPGTWRVGAEHLPRPNPARVFRVSGPDGVRWESTAATLDGDVLVLDCKRATPGGDS